MPESSIIILIDGGGYKAGALTWLKNTARSCREKDIRVYNMTEFTTWANRTL